MKLEVVVIPVSDVDRAKRFYGEPRLEARRRLRHRRRHFGSCSSRRPARRARSTSARASRRLRPARRRASTDRLRHRGGARRARRPRRRGQRGVPRAGHGGADRVSGPDPERAQLPLVRLVQRSGRQRLAAAGGHRAVARPRRRRRDDIRLRNRSGERAPARGGRPRRAREAHGGRRDDELAGLVRRVHGARSRPRQAAAVDERPRGN